jgi:hypothetical protein
VTHHRACPQINDPAKPCFCPPQWHTLTPAEQAGDFALTAPPWPPAGRGSESRGTRTHRLEGVRRKKMQDNHGPGPAGVTCKDCLFLIRTGGHKTFLKCKKYGVSSADSTDWRQKWPSCGAYQQRGSR